ncbi:MAG: Gfo/Idh/MocA family protein [Clostridia bacterium]
MQRACVIGMGLSAITMPVYASLPNAELVGVCDRQPDRADAAAKKYGVPAFYSAQEMLDALKPDICSVATGGYEYSSDHFEPTIQALEAGAHVLCESPFPMIWGMRERWWTRQSG